MRRVCDFGAVTAELDGATLFDKALGVIWREFFLARERDRNREFFRAVLGECGTYNLVRLYVSACVHDVHLHRDSLLSHTPLLESYLLLAQYISGCIKYCLLVWFVSSDENSARNVVSSGLRSVCFSVLAVPAVAE
eukprot:m.19015 g.19015  ORF g.19015 m.19015 type:complete len:136 (+) comp11677_c0_seq2:126-533(+)